MFKILSFLLSVFFICIKINIVKNETIAVSKILFMSPKDSNQKIQLNNIDGFLNNRFQKGWYLQENEIHTFFIYVLNDTSISKKSSKQSSETIIRRLRDSEDSIEKHSFYLYFTLNPVSCDDYLYYTHIPIRVTDSNKFSKKKNILRFEISFSLKYSQTPYYICLSKHYESLKELSSETMLFFHQGNETHLSISTYTIGYPVSFKIFIYVILVFLNSVFNGLNLGLMSLSIEELEMLVKTGESHSERKYAKNILPLRKKGNFLLCSILLSIAMTSSVSTLVLDDLVNGFLAGIISTITLCIIGEITPQAICTRYSLPIGSYTRNVTYLFMYLTAVVSYPLSKLVDLVLGAEIPTKYNRNIIKELIKKSKCLKEKQCQIISGVLDSKEKTVNNIMTDLDQVYMIREDEKISFETMVTIYDSGYSRIPVYKDRRENIVGLFHVKDMALINPDDEILVKELLLLYKHNVVFCYNTDSLPEIFDMFRKGMAHMAFVLDKNDKENELRCIGIVTLHDIIEALLQFKILDEIKTKRYGISYLKKIVEKKKRQSLSFIKSEEDKLKLISSPTVNLQTKFLLMQILANIKPFSEEFIDKSVIEKLIENDDNYVCRYLNIFQKNETKIEQNKYLYKYGESADYFLLLIEGSYLIEAGSEKTEFCAKQFDHFGEKALLGECESLVDVLDNSIIHKSYVPEFSLRIDFDNILEFNDQKQSNLVYFKISRTKWLAAVKATSLKRNKNDN